MSTTESTIRLVFETSDGSIRIQPTYDKVGELEATTPSHWRATISYWKRTYVASGYSTRALAVAAVQAKVNAGWHWRR